MGKTNGKVAAKGCGKAVIMVKAAGTANYKPAKKTVTVTVAPKQQKISSLKSLKSKSFVIKWKKDSKATGYQVQYATNKKFKKAKSVTINKSKTVSKTINKTKAKKRYYVRLRSYKASGKTKIYGAWSKSKSVVIKK